MFHFPGSRSLHCCKVIKISLYGVSSFGNFRIKGCLAPPRNISSPRHVLHRLFKPRHPPYALIRFKYCIVHPYHSGEWQVCLIITLLLVAFHIRAAARAAPTGTNKNCFPNMSKNLASPRPSPKEREVLAL